jgi:hypothetical protein
MMPGCETARHGSPRTVWGVGRHRAKRVFLLGKIAITSREAAAAHGARSAGGHDW